MQVYELNFVELECRIFASLALVWPVQRSLLYEWALPFPTPVVPLRARKAVV